MRAITTKHLAPTNTRGSRIKAFSEKCSVTISYPMKYDDCYQAHESAALELCKKYEWNMGKGGHLENYKLVGGGYEQGYHWVFVFTGK